MTTHPLAHPLAHPSAQTYRAGTVDVIGGELAYGVWGPDDPDAPVVLAVHGITANHRCWPLVAERLPGVRVVAPDLRGRGRSSGLGPPYGLGQHAVDLERLLDGLGLDRVSVVGHSMGAFVAVSLAARIGDRASALVLVDGGIPLVAPEGQGPRPGATAEEVLGPAAARLSMPFVSYEAYRDFWRAHPALADHWNPTIEGYVDYDLEGTAPHLQPSPVVEAIVADSLELFGSDTYERALTGLAVPVTFLRAPRGLMDEPQALYPQDAARTVGPWLPHARTVEVEDINHYTIVMAPRGAERVAEEVRALMHD